MQLAYYTLLSFWLMSNIQKFFLTEIVLSNKNNVTK